VGKGVRKSNDIPLNTRTPPDDPMDPMLPDKYTEPTTFGNTGGVPATIFTPAVPYTKLYPAREPKGVTAPA
jgi:hypothetical protein